MDYSLEDRLVAGLLSHGFKEKAPDDCPEGFRGFERLGREDRWLNCATHEILVGEIGSGECLKIPLHLRLQQPFGPITLSDQHALYLKCGDIYLRTRERSAKAPDLFLNPDELLDELAGRK